MTRPLFSPLFSPFPGAFPEPPRAVVLPRFPRSRSTFFFSVGRPWLLSFFFFGAGRIRRRAPVTPKDEFASHVARSPLFLSSFLLSPVDRLGRSITGRPRFPPFSPRRSPPSEQTVRFGTTFLPKRDEPVPPSPPPLLLFDKTK